MVAGDLRFKRDDALRGLDGAGAKELCWMEETEHLRNVGAVGGQRLSVGGLTVVRLIRQAQARLDEVGHRGVPEGILLHPVGQRGPNTGAVQLAEGGGELGGGGDVD